MHSATTLVAIGGSFLAAGLLARAGSHLGLPTIPLFMLAGILLGPHTPGLELVSEPGDLELLAVIGLVFLLFYLGLEFSVDELGEGRRVVWAGGAYIALNVGGGLAFGFLLDWGMREALVLGGVIGISSSAIATKVLIELGRLKRPETPLILGIIVIEDLFLALYLAMLNPVLGNAQGVGEAAAQFGIALAFLLVLAAVARWGGQHVGRLVDSGDDELLVVCFAGIALLTAGVAAELGVSDAIGAFMAGLILGSSSARERIAKFVHPLRDAFGALFFFAFGVAIAPGDVLTVAVPVLVAVVLTVVLNVIAGGVAARLNRLPRLAAANIGLTVVARGEFALVLASLAAAAGLDKRIAPFVAGYVLLLAILGPLAATRSGTLVVLVPRRLVGQPA